MMTPDKQEIHTPVMVFLSYAHEDEPLRAQLEKHLRLLQRQGLVSTWHDRQIEPGTNWAQEIDEHLESASIILLLVSPDFFAPDYCYDIEMQRALERHTLGKARVIPIILRPVDWHDAPFGYLQCLPRDGKPATEWDNQDIAFRDIARGIRRAITGGTSSVASSFPLSARDRQNRERMLRRLRRTYTDLLTQSLQGAARLELGLAERLDAVQNATNLLLRRPHRPDQPLAAGTSITQAYEEAEHELLILGEPGAGKSTLLLDLAQQLVEWAEAEDAQPLPVLLPLSSWAFTRLPLEDWLTEQVAQIYDIPNQVAAGWVHTDQLLPLLDGLDEMKERARPACISAINTYHHAHAGPLAICSRSVEL